MTALTVFLGFVGLIAVILLAFVIGYAMGQAEEIRRHEQDQSQWDYYGEANDVDWGDDEMEEPLVDRSKT